MHRTQGLAVPPAVVSWAATKAAFGVMRQVMDRNEWHFGLRLQVFDSIVMPILRYGGEVWSTGYLRNLPLSFDNPTQLMQTRFLRQVSGE